MSSAETVHEDGQIFRRITVGAVTYSWELVGDDESDLESYEYQGDEAPDEAIDALQEWIEEFHGDGDDE